MDLRRTTTALAPARALALLGLAAALTACSGDFSTDEAPQSTSLDTSADWDDEETGWGDGDPGDGDGDPNPEPGDGDPSDAGCLLDCGLGECVVASLEQYCECPEETAWGLQSCDPCPLIDAVGHDIDLTYVDLSGQFELAGAPAPASEYDDANIWLENARTGDRVLVGNTHDQQFQVRVTPGIYDLIYEVETPGALLPHNPRVALTKLALLNSQPMDIEIPVVQLSGQFLINGQVPPVSEYDDAELFLRDDKTGAEVLLGNTHDVDYAVPVVPGDYDLIYRVETPGVVCPHNDGAELVEALELFEGAMLLDVDVPSVALSGAFAINGAPPPASEYNDANISLESESGGSVYVGNTHDGAYDLPVIPGDYELFYMHETGFDVPQNQRARVTMVSVAEGGPTQLDVPMVQLGGALTINGVPAPASEYDDGVVYLSAAGSSDFVLLANTHDLSYQANVVAGVYDVFYSQETAGGTVPENKRARVGQAIDATFDGVLDIDVPAVSISGSLTFNGVAPPSSVYEDGRIYLRNPETDDALLLGSTHSGSYDAVVVPGDYELFYVQEAGGEVPSNQNASLGPVTILGPMALDLDVPTVDLSGQVLLDGMPAPASSNDGGQLYLRALDGDSVLLGNSFEPSYSARLVTGTYGIYYRSAASLTTPQNENGRLGCIRVE